LTFRKKKEEGRIRERRKKEKRRPLSHTGFQNNGKSEGGTE